MRSHNRRACSIAILGISLMGAPTGAQSPQPVVVQEIQRSGTTAVVGLPSGAESGKVNLPRFFASLKATAGATTRGRAKSQTSQRYPSFPNQTIGL